MFGGKDMQLKLVNWVQGQRAGGLSLAAQEEVSRLEGEFPEGLLVGVDEEE